MKIKAVYIVITAIAVSCLVGALCLRSKDQKIESAEVEENGVRVKLSVFMLPKVMNIPALYQPGNLKEGLRKYSWVKPLLFSRFGFELYVPQEEWNEYVAYDRSEKLYSLLKKRAEEMKEAVLVKEKDFWSKVKHEVSEVVLCETKDENILIICVRSIKPDGTEFGCEYHKLVYVQGRWKRGNNDLGVLPCMPSKFYEKALQLVKEGKLKGNPISLLR